MRSLLLCFVLSFGLFASAEVRKLSLIKFAKLRLSNFLFYIILINLLITLIISASYIPICGRRNPNLNDCIVKSVNQIRPKLHEGIPELDVPPVDPLLIKERLTISDTADFKVVASNIRIYDSLDFEIKEFNIDLQNHKIDINLFFKKMRFENDYDVKVKIIVPIEASGPIESVGCK